MKCPFMPPDSRGPEHPDDHPDVIHFGPANCLETDCALFDAGYMLCGILSIAYAIRDVREFLAIGE